MIATPPFVCCTSGYIESHQRILKRLERMFDICLAQNDLGDDYIVSHYIVSDVIWNSEVTLRPHSTKSPSPAEP